MTILQNDIEKRDTIWLQNNIYYTWQKLIIPYNILVATNFPDFPWFGFDSPDFQGLKNEWKKFPDFPDFPWYVQTL